MAEIKFYQVFTEYQGLRELIKSLFKSVIADFYNPQNEPFSHF